MTEQPILTLGTRIGVDPDERVNISYFNDETQWTSLHVPLKLGDSLVQALTDRGMNVYLMVNQTTEKLSTPRGKAEDITKLRAVYADLDIKGNGLPSMEAAQNVIDMLSDIINCKPTATVMSGHGLQPYWEVEDGEITDANRPYIMGILKRWGLLVQRLAEVEHGKADNVYDLPRVLRAPGSRNMKEPGNPIEVTMEVNEWTHPVTIAEIAEAVEAYGFLNEQFTVRELDVVSDPMTWEPAERDCMWSQTLASEISQTNPGARHPWLLAMAIKIECCARFGCITEETYGELVKLLEAKFLSLISMGATPRAPAPGEVNTAFKWARAQVSTYSEVKLNDNVGYHKHKLYAVPDLPFESGPDEPSSNASAATTVSGNLALAPEFAPIALGDENFAYTDAANAERLSKIARGQYIYVPSLGWHVWHDGKYVADETSSIVRLAIDSMRRLPEDDSSKEAMKWAQSSMSGRGISTCVKLAESVPELVVTSVKLDVDPLILCTPGGIVSLADGHLRPARPEVDFNTRQTAVTPQFGPMPKFLRFLDQILGDIPEEAEERIEYVQKLFGIAAIGELRWQILPIFSGPGANGKSALLEIIASVLGTYAAMMPENFLLESGKVEHSTEIMRLRGARLAIASETRPDGKFNESRVKTLTGEGMLSARAMRQDFVDFKATHTLFMSLNHPPQVRSGGDGFWRRIRKIDFRYIIPLHLQDPGFAATVAEEEGAAILQWVIEGAQKVLKEGLTSPLSVEMSTLSYRAEEDHVDIFLQDCTSPNPEAGFSVTELYGTYTAWCRKNGELPITSVSLMRDLKTRMSLTPYRSKHSRGYKGLIVYTNYGEEALVEPPRPFGKGTP